MMPTFITRLPRELQGMLCAFFAYMLFSLQDAAISVTTKVYPPIQMIWLNAVLILVILLAAVTFRKGVAGLKAVVHTSQLRLHVVRGVIIAIAMGVSLSALRHLPLPNFYVIVFMSPLLSAVLSSVFLKEHVGWAKGAALVAGFAGLCIALNPQSAAFNHVAYLVLIAAFLFSVGGIFSRFLGRQDGVPVLMFFPQVAVVIIFAVPALQAWQPVSLEHVGIALLTALLAASAFGLNSKAYRLAPLYLLAPCQFMQFLWGVLLQLTLYGFWPQKSIVFGAVLIIFSNLFIVYLQARGHMRAAAKEETP